MKWCGALLPLGCAVVVAVSFTTGCATQTRRFWLNVFFEGVEKTNGVKTTSMQGTVREETIAESLQVAKPAEPSLVVHAPYADRKCAGCHESTFSQKLRGDLGDACLGCHTKLLPQGRTWHAPAASGDCALCHEPHQSSRKFLLTQPSDLLCAQCHAPAEMATVPAHQGKEKAACTTCHDPHQAEGNFLLRNKVPAGVSSAVSQPTATEVPAIAPTTSRSEDGVPAPAVTNPAASLPKK